MIPEQHAARPQEATVRRVVLTLICFVLAACETDDERRDDWIQAGILIWNGSHVEIKDAVARAGEMRRKAIAKHEAKIERFRALRFGEER